MNPVVTETPSAVGYVSMTTTTELGELEAGIDFWRRHGKWPVDLHNADYQRWYDENPHGEFTLEWWTPFLRTLNGWRATRPATGQVLTSNFLAVQGALSKTWASACEPFFDSDIAAVTWEQLEAFPTLVGTIKPMMGPPSPVFTSKFCHFLLPRIFPVFDNEGLGGRWRTFETYFKSVQDEWRSTAQADRDDLVDFVRTMIEGTGANVAAGFPFACKITELRLIGRHHGRKG